jgi:hypothetical protein
MIELPTNDNNGLANSQNSGSTGSSSGDYTDPGSKDIQRYRITVTRLDSVRFPSDSRTK